MIVEHKFKTRTGIFRIWEESISTSRGKNWLITTPYLRPVSPWFKRTIKYLSLFNYAQVVASTDLFLSINNLDAVVSALISAVVSIKLRNVSP